MTADTAVIAGPDPCESCGLGRSCPGLPVCVRCLPARLGMTYRQLDWWTRHGYLRPVRARGDGSGKPRQWPEEELEIARRMARLTDAGIALPTAAAFARDKWPDGEIAPGVAIHVSEGAPA